MIFEPVAAELVRVVDRAVSDLRALNDGDASVKAKADVWSKKEILGHLIDSAANNHQRFVRAQLSSELSYPGYEQNAWVATQAYQGRPWSELVDLWVGYNHHLAHIIARMPDAAAHVPCRIAAGAPLALRTLVEDYIAHVQHHLAQIQERQPHAS